MKSESKIAIKGYIFPAVTIAFGAVAVLTGNAAVAATAVALAWVNIVLMALLFVAMVANSDTVEKTPMTLLRCALSTVFALLLFSVLAAIDAVVTASAFAVTYFMLMLMRITLDKR